MKPRFLMEKSSKKFLERLLNTVGPSGFEQEAAGVWREEAKTFTKHVSGDVHGNSHAIVNQGGSPRVMLAGHVDEIGFMITSIDDKGFLYMAPVGGWDPQILQGHRVWIRTAQGRILGVIGKKAIHLMKEEERRQVTRIDQLWIDIGAKNKKEAEKRVAVGDPIVLAWGPEYLTDDFITSKGIDDKVGAFVVLEAARLLSHLKPKAEIHTVATVQEEIGLRGAITSAHGVDPLVGIAVDVTFANDHPKAPGHGEASVIALGKGPVIYRGANINHALFDLFVETARKKKIPHQIAGVPGGTGTDANAIQLARAGVAAGLISIPNRYMHSPCEVVHLGDLVHAAELIAHTVESITAKTNFIP